jgi:RNA polymerase sigma-70 factor (ECF subfamily)
MQFETASALTTPWVRMHALEEAGSLVTEDSQRVTITDDSDLADIRAAAGGDGEAYARVIGRYQNTIARRVLRFSRDTRTLEELVHDVFVEAYFGLKGYRGDAPFEHWLQRIATRVGYRYWTQRARESDRQSIQLYEPEAVVHGQSLDDQDEVAVALEQLPPRDRLVLTLLYLESRSVAEAADLAGWSESMIKVQAHRARQKLRTLVEQSRLAVAKENDNG